MSEKVKIVFWQTTGGSVEVPRDQLKAFVEAVECNCTDMGEWEEVMKTFDPSHYEGDVVSIEDTKGEYLEIP